MSVAVKTGVGVSVSGQIDFSKVTYDMLCLYYLWSIGWERSGSVLGGVEASGAVSVFVPVVASLERF